MSSSTRGAARRSARSSAACTPVGGPAKRLRRDGGRKNQSQCANCGSSIADNSGLFRFLPCQHEVCPLCAYTSQVNRGSNAHKCPVEGCRQYSTSCDYVVSGVTKKNIPNKASNDPEWLKTNNPREYLVQQHLPEFNRRAANGAISLSCTKLFVEAERLKSKTVTSTFSYKKDKDGSYEILNPQRAIMGLRLFGAYLHGPIVIASNGPKEVPVMSPKELMECRSKDGGSSFLDALLYSMSTGVGVNERDLARLSTCLLEDILFAQNNAALLESGDKNEPTKLARFDRSNCSQAAADPREILQLLLFVLQCRETSCQQI